MPEKSPSCWLCRCNDLTLVKPANLPADLTPSEFAITGSQYGMTAAIYACRACGFRFCPNLEDVVDFYVEMEDPEFEASGQARRLQANGLIDEIARSIPSGTLQRGLLDIGAGSGHLVEAALARGWDAEGVEPSRWLCARAREKNLVVHEGVLPLAGVGRNFGIVTLIDVIEHVSDPLALLRAASEHLAPDGLMVIVTPDVGSWAARLMGKRWWHYRPAHIGYFDHATLNGAVESIGFRVERWSRPRWILPAGYLMERVLAYFPGLKRLRMPERLHAIPVPFNLRDSFLVVARRR